VCTCERAYIDHEKLRIAQSDEQARAGAEAGSRLLEYITRGAMPGIAGEESKSKLPLFMRVNGNSAHGSLHEGASHKLMRGIISRLGKVLAPHASCRMWVLISAARAKR